MQHVSIATSICTLTARAQIILNECVQQLQYFQCQNVHESRQIRVKLTCSPNKCANATNCNKTKAFHLIDTEQLFPTIMQSLSATTRLTAFLVSQFMKSAGLAKEEFFSTVNYSAQHTILTFHVPDLWFQTCSHLFVFSRGLLQNASLSGKHSNLVFSSNL